MKNPISIGFAVVGLLSVLVACNEPIKRPDISEHLKKTTLEKPITKPKALQPQQGRTIDVDKEKTAALGLTQQEIGTVLGKLLRSGVNANKVLEEKVTFKDREGKDFTIQLKEVASYRE